MKRFFTYILLATIVLACHIETPQRPAAKFTFTPGSGCKAPCTVVFKSEVANAKSIEWYIDDEIVFATGDSATHQFLTAKSYQVKMIVRGVDGGSSGYTQTLTIDAPSPEAFSLSGGQNFPTDIVADAKGNVYISGTGTGEITFGIDKIANLSKGLDDFFVAKYNSAGQCQWVYTDGSSGNDHANAITLDSAGYLYVTGFVSNHVASEGSSAKGGLDGFVARLDALNGKLDWFTTFGGPLDDQGRSLAFYQVSEGKKLYLTGTVEGDGATTNVEFGSSRESANGRDGFLVLLDALSGTFEKPIMITGPNIQAPEAITIDGYGNAYLAGAFIKTVNISSLSRTSADSVDVFVAKWKRTGQVFQWVRRAASTGVDFAYDIIVDKNSQNVFVTGMHTGYIEELKLNSSGEENVYLGKWDANGTVQIARNGFSDGNQDYHGGIAWAPNGDIYIAGSFSNKGWFPMSSDMFVTSKGSTDIIISKLDPKGLNPTTEKIVADGGNDEDRVNKICVSNGYVYAVGWFHGSSTFNGVNLNGEPYPIRNTFIARYKL